MLQSLSALGWRRLSRRSYWPFAALILLLLLWLWLVFEAIATSGGPNGQVFGVDFSHTYAAALILAKGGNPYDAHSLSVIQHALLRGPGLPVEPASPTVRVGTSPFFLWAWRPLDALHYQAAAIVWMLCTYALVAVGFLALLRYLGWRRRVLPTLVFLATPQVVLGTFYGNVIDLVFFGLTCSLPLLERRPFVAGVLLSLATLKPQVALPVVLLVVLFQAPRKKGVIAGFCAAVGVRQLFTLVVLGPQYEWGWVRSLLGFSSSIDLQPNLASLSGLYVRWTPHSIGDGLELLSVVFACGLTTAYWWRARRQTGVPLLAMGSLWFVWMVATPYAHFVDEMLLVVPVLWLIGPDGRRLTAPVSVVVLYLMTLSIMLFSWPPLPGQFLWLPLVAVAACFEVASRRGAGRPARSLPREEVAEPSVPPLALELSAS